MLNKTFLKMLAVAFLISLFFHTDLYASSKGKSENSNAAKRPNILLIIADDIGVDVASNMYPGLIDNLDKKYGPSGLNHPDYKKISGSPASTPRLDKLAGEGMVFSNTWAHPFCSPTRAAILTGLFGKSTKVLTYADALSQNHTTFVQKLKDDGGYSTGIFGKWHMAGLPGTDGKPDYPGMKPKEAGFDIFKGNLHAALKTFWEYDYQVQDDRTPANEWRTEAAPVRSLPGMAPSTFAPKVKVADTIEWITDNEKKNPDKPWFAWLAFNLSHATIVSDPSAMVVPDADTLDDPTLAEMKACGGKFGSNNTGTCSGESLMRAMTNALDTVTGKLLDAVEKLDPNTYIILIGDNGTPMYGWENMDFIDNMYITKKGRGKGTAYESGARVPMMVKGPGIEANSRSDEFIHAVDLFSTTLALAGLDIPEQVNDSEGNGSIPLDSVSLAPVLFDKTKNVRDPDEGYILTESLNLLKNNAKYIGARNAKYKVMCLGDSEGDRCLFFNLADDPLEEYPLKVPGICSKYNGKKPAPEDPGWHYCHLMNVIRERSFAGALGKKE